MKSNLIWLDLEMTGLHPESDVILEIATIVTNKDLDLIAEGPNLAVQQSKARLDGMDEWCREHHGSSGLVQRVLEAGVPLQEAESRTLEFLQKHCEAGQSPLCGNSIGQDRRFLVKYMPHLNDFFHYRSVDVSSIKELATRWYPNLAPLAKKETHLALQDIRESIEELKHYRENIFVPKGSTGS